MELKIKRDLRFMKHKSKMYSQYDVWKFDSLKSKHCIQ